MACSHLFWKNKYLYINREWWIRIYSNLMPPGRRMGNDQLIFVVRKLYTMYSFVLFEEVDVSPIRKNKCNVRRNGTSFY